MRDARTKRSPRAAAPSVEIRPARKADLPALGRLGAALARAHHEWDPGRFFVEPRMEKGYAWWLGHELENRKAVVLAAVRGRQVVGYAYGRVEPRDWNLLRDRCAVAVDLMVAPGARRGGVGRRLCEALIEALAAKGAPFVVLQVAWPNRVAQRLFRSIRFRPTIIEMTRQLEPRRGGGRAHRPAAHR